MRKLLKEIDRLLAQNKGMVLASILHHSGSTPRSSGARMIIQEDGSIAGTVGGGLLEAKIYEIGLGVRETRWPRLEKLAFTGADASVSDMICGGEVEVLVEWLDPQNAQKCVSLQEMKTDVDAMGTVYIFGAGHVSQALAQITQLTGFFTVVLDDRSEFANTARFPGADKIMTPDPIQSAFSSLSIDANSYIVIVTRGHLHDKNVLDEALKTSARYIGMIGSKRKCALIFDDLRKFGWGETDFLRVNAPIGINISSETPEEIAVSITAEMIQRRAHRQS